ncbi:MAG: hypothetical protein ACRENB_13275 [Gemmatimonadales bacterium]
MSRRAFLVAGCLAAFGGEAAAQSSQFGVRGLGLPVRPISVRGYATGGSFSLFDAESGLNPASFGLVPAVSASFQTVQSWRSSSSPAGDASARDQRFPGIAVTGPIGTSRFSLGLSASGYTDRNFTLASRDTLLLRGVPVEALDTLISHGGLSDLRIAGAWAPSGRLQVGVGLHMITGSNRIESRRAFSDTSYASAVERFTMSYLGFGVSGGVVARLSRRFTLAGMARYDGTLKVERDSVPTADTRLPLTLSAGLRVQVSERLMGAVYGTRRTWSRSDADLVAQGGIGSDDTAEIGFGLELLSDPRRPGHRPMRVGARRASLPFPLQRGQEVVETGVSLGTGFRFVADRAGLDLALERVWRSGGEGFSERATMLHLGVTVRP